MAFGAALSEHPLATHAVGEVVGQVLEHVGEQPDLAIVFVTEAHGGALEDIAATIRSTLRPVTLLGCTASSVVGNEREVEGQPAIALWAGHAGLVMPVLLRLETRPDGTAVIGWPAEPPPTAGSLLLLVDPFTFPTDAFLRGLRDQADAWLPVVGGMASAGRGPGGNRLVVNDTVVTEGAVGALIGGVEVESVVSQGCRPIGDPFVVTKAETSPHGTRIYELGGRSALERIQELVTALGPDDRMLLQRGLHLGRVIDEHRVEFDRGDFLIRNVLGGDPETGMIQVGDEVELGGTVQFQVRDAASADEDLRELLQGRQADGALLFTCNGRGTNLFGVPDQDAAVLAEKLGPAPVAGMFCQGEIGPVGTESFVHGFTASVVLFRGP